ncbi:hypothetical protein BH09GEM1_BH09GEM1_48120 [soil metagenome]
MPRLVIKDQTSGRAYELDATEGLVGRDPSCAIALDADAARMVSARHAKFLAVDGVWYVEDAASSNGTFVDDVRLEAGARQALAIGSVVRLGKTGPRFVVDEAQVRVAAATMLESIPDPGGPATTPIRRSEAVRAGIRDLGGLDGGTVPAYGRGAAPAPPPAPALTPPPTGAEVSVTLRDVQSGKTFSAHAASIAFGRAPECAVQIEGEAANAVSRVHSEIVAENDMAVLRDAGSRNGTFLNGKRVATPQPLKHGDLVALGAGGPSFTISAVAIGAGAFTAAPKTQAAQTVGAVVGGINAGAAVDVASVKGPATRLARASMGVGRTALFRNVLAEVSQKNNRRLRVVVWSTVAAGVALTAGVVVFARIQMTRTEHALEVERAGFNTKTTQMAAELVAVRRSATLEATRARTALDSAMRASAPNAVLDSLRKQLSGADARTAALEQSLERARGSLTLQLAVGDSVRRSTENELTRLRVQIAGAQDAGTDSRIVLDSLRRVLSRAEDRARNVGDQIKAVRGVDLAQVSQLNQSAVGLVTVFVGKDIYDGSGFVISPGGYLVTNRHVVRPDTSVAADSIMVTMADQRYAVRADVVPLARASVQDVALLKIRDYHGPFLARLDWTGTHAVQGEPAALIGFPAGSDNALDSARVVRSSMSAGIFSKVTGDQIQFDGFTIGGSSGSPVFNASGEVVAIHRAGLKQGPGLGFAVPLSRLSPLLRPEVRAELGLR